MDGLAARYRWAREATRGLCRPLEIEDHVVQPAPDVSPPKWHLGHTTWFFETFALERWSPGYRRFDESFPVVFNSYYQSIGAPYPRGMRGTRSRPTLSRVLAYRDAVDEALVRLLERRPGAELARVVELGINHEQQHQELLVADIKLILAHNGALDSYPGGAFAPGSGVRAAPPPPRRARFAGGVLGLGHSGEGFSFDNERPRHMTLVRPFRLAGRLVTNGEYREFIEDGGYSEFRHWLSDGWDMVLREGWEAPLYWSEALVPADPVCHLSHYEADAFARWAGARLPTEAEWEFAAASLEPEEGRFLEDGVWRPRAAPHGAGLAQLFGDAWEWTSSAYGPYPGYRPARGAFGEYNGKFMSGQMVLRGGSCATPRGHVRRTYRNFFAPGKRWQFLGVRLAWDD